MRGAATVRFILDFEVQRVCRKSVALVFRGAIVTRSRQSRARATCSVPLPHRPAALRPARSQFAATRRSGCPRAVTNIFLPLLPQHAQRFPTHKTTKTAPLNPTTGTRESRAVKSIGEVETMQTKLISGSYTSIMNKQDLLREVVVKYIDYFYPV